MPLIASRAGGSASFLGGLGASVAVVPVTGFFSFGTQEITTDTATVVFSGIPQNAKHLQFRFMGRASGVGNRTSLCIRVNGDTGSNYFQGGLSFGDAGNTASNFYNNNNLMFEGINSIPKSDANASTTGIGVGNVLDYTATKKKTFSFITHSQKNDSTNRGGFFSGVFNNTAPITSLTFSLNGFDFLAGSRISLYGIEG